MTVTNNLAMEFVVTTRDKVSDALHVALPRFKASYEWTAPASVATTVWVTLLTSDFNEVLGVSPDSIKGGFVVVGVGSVLWLLGSLVKLWKRAFRHKDVVDAIIQTHDDSASPTLQGFIVTENS